MQATSFTHYRSYRTPVAGVWPYLTRPDLISRWLGSADFELTHEGAMGVKFWNGDIVRGRVLAAAAPVRLEFMWRPFDFEPETHVAWKLSGDGPGSRLTVTHDGLRSKEERDHARLLWRHSLDALREAVDSGATAPEWGETIPVVTRTELPRTSSDLWPMISTASGLAKWVANVEQFDAQQGGSFRFRSRYRGQDVIEQGRVEEIVSEARVRLSWEWIGEGWGGPTDLSFVLSRETTGVRVLIAHSGFDRIAPEKRVDARRNYATAWPEVLADLRRLMAPVPTR